MNKVMQQAMLHASKCRRLIDEAKAPAIALQQAIEQARLEAEKLTAETHAIVPPLRKRVTPIVKNNLLRCNRCLTFKPFSEYYERLGSSTGTCFVCKECMREYAKVKQREYRKLNKQSKSC